jgi:hypothetical protein
VGSGQAVDWYSAASGGTLLASGTTAFTPTAPGTYYAEAREIVSNCTSNTRTAVTVTVNPLPTASVSGTTTICEGDAAVDFTFTGTPDAIVTYNIDGGATTTITLDGTGSATLQASNTSTSTVNLVSVANTSTSCTAAASGSATVTVNPLPIVFNVTGGGAYCSDNEMAQAIGLDGSETGVEYALILNGTTTVEIIPGTGSALSFTAQTTAGTYTVLATRTTGELCNRNMLGSAEITITDKLFAGADNSAEFCEGSGAAYDLTALLSGADAGGTWLQTGGAAIDISTPSVVDFSAAAPGTYTFTYTHAASGSCPLSQATFTITIEDRLDAGENGTLNICAGEAVTEAALFASLGGTPDGGGVWTPALAGAGTYTYTQAATANCAASSAGVVVTETTGLDAGENGTLVICAGEMVTEAQLFASLGGMPDAGGAWSPALAGAGTYTYTQPAVGVCPSTNAQVVVIETPNPDAGLITNGDAVCLGDPAFITLSASEPGISYQLRLESDDSNVGSPLIGNGGMLSFSATTSSTAQYNILATNTVTSCAVELANKPIVTVFVPSSAGADNSDEICAGNGSSYNLVGLLVAADPGGTWLQTGGSSSINLSNPIDVDFSNALPGEYTFTYTHAANGSCPADQAVLTVTVTSLELSNVSVSDPTCPSKDNGSIVITASTSGTQTILYSIDNGVTFQASNTFDGLTGGTYDLVVQLDIPIGCNVAPLQVTLNTPDCLPLANDDVVSTDADTPLNIPVLANDDFGGDGASMGTITIIASPMNGTAVVNDNGTPTDPTDDTIDYTPNTGFSGSDNLFYEICDADGDCDDAEVLISVAPPPFVALRPKMMLQGALLGTSDGLMRDDLRTTNVLPLEEPYAGLGFTQLGGGGETITVPSIVLSDYGPNSIVDWVHVELRDANNPAVILATQSALLQRDGDVVDMDGTSALTFSQNTAGTYYVAVRHRNHLGVMTASPVEMDQTEVIVDFTSPTLEVYHTAGIYDGLERANVNGMRALWAGNDNMDGQVVFAGQDNDKDPIFNAIDQNPNNFFNLQTYILPGYELGDVNLDGNSVFAGQGNDVDPIFNNIDGYLANFLRLQTFVLPEQLP